MPDGSNPLRAGEGVFPSYGSKTAASLQDIRRGLSRAWVLMLESQIDQALTVLKAIERQLDDLSPPVATRYRAATKLLRLAVVAFRDDRLAVLAIVISQVFVEGGAGLDMPLTETWSRIEALEPTEHRPLALMRSAGNGAPQPDSSVGDAITARERDVLSMIGQGHSNKHIARSLEISPETVKSHVKHIFSKLDVATRSEAVSRALSLGLLQPAYPPSARHADPRSGDRAADENVRSLGAKRFATEGAS
jgi:LuxR family maltose regulon positive regulatory protein